MTDEPELFAFTPVPLRRSHNGWSPGRQRDFILTLARGASVREAAATAGLSRQSAYSLRRKPGAEGFAAAWDKAQAFAHDVRTAGTRGADRHFLFDTLLVPRFHGGRLLGFVQREDDRRLFADLRRLEKMTSRRPAPAPEADASARACHG